MLPRYKLREMAFLATVFVASAFMLLQSTRLDFFVRETIGPGFYPALVLGALALFSFAALIGAIARREIHLLSPFIEGLHEDTMLRGVARGAARVLGVQVRVIVRNGAGVFSAAWAGARAADGATLTVISSETPDMSSAQVAAWSIERFAPIARLYFDPDVLVASPDTDLDTLLSRGTRACFAFAAAPDGIQAVRAWLAARFGHDADALAGAAHEVDASLLRAMVRRRELDAAVLPLGEARDALAVGTLRALVVFADEPDAAGIGPASGTVGAPLIAGAWAGVGVPPRAEGQQAEALQHAMAEGLTEYRRGGGEDDAKWSIEPPERLREFLGKLAPASDGPAVLPTGRLAGLLLAAGGTVGFSGLMQLLGFPLAAFTFLCTVMLLLEPKLNRAALLRIAAIAAVVAIGLHQLFWRVFYVVFPDALLLGG